LLQEIETKVQYYGSPMGSGTIPAVGLDDGILSPLNEFPFHGLRSLFRFPKWLSSTIRDHFLREGFAVERLKWVPYPLTPAHKQQRLKLSEDLLKTLAAALRDSGDHFATGDQSRL
jgi:hypothetical protein